MNSPSPLIPQGSNLEQQNKTRSSLRLKIFCALGANVAVLLVLLMQGCKREQPVVEPEVLPVNFDTNPPTVIEPMDTNLPTTTAVDTSTVPTTVPTTVTLPPDTTTPIALPATQEYVIKSGDTYSSIAPKFGVTLRALQTANPGVDPAKLQIGKKIIIPAPTPSDPPAAGPVVDAASGEVIHTVKSGDTLSKLATEYRTKVEAIQRANGLPDSRIKVGQKLKIPKS